MKIKYNYIFFKFNLKIKSNVNFFKNLTTFDAEDSKYKKTTRITSGNNSINRYYIYYLLVINKHTIYNIKFI